MRQKKRILKCNCNRSFLRSDKNKLLIVPAVSLVAVLGLLVFPTCSDSTPAFAAEAASDFSIRLSIDGAEASNTPINKEQEVNAGQVGYISTNFTVTTQSAESYSVYLKPTNSNNTSLVGKDYSTNIIPSLEVNTDITNFPTNHWGYSLTNNTSASTDSLTYSPIPNGSTYIKSVSNPDNGDDNYKLVFAAKIGDNKPADHYQAEMELSVLASPKTMTTYTITYDANGGTGAANPASQTASDSASSHTFQAAAQGTLTKSGYNFLGWADSSTATTAQYLAGANITVNSSIPSKTIYAVWQKITPDTACASGSVADDAGNTYTVTKLKDGNCWMTQNMRYIGDDITAVATNVTYNAQYGQFYNFTTAIEVCKKLAGGSGGWTLPSQIQWQDLVSNVSTGGTLTLEPYNMLYGGTFSGNSFSYQGSRGYYWSSTENDSTRAYNIFFYRDSVNPNNYDIKANGMPVRCVVSGN